MNFYLDIGHGNGVPGAVGPTGLQEAAATGQLAEKIARRFPNFTEVPRIDIRDRMEWITKHCLPPGLLISLHFNAWRTVRPEYCSTWTHPAHNESRGHAAAIHPFVVKMSGNPDGGLRVANFGILRSAMGVRLPAVLLEPGFISNPAYEARLKDESYLDLLAQGVLAGVKSAVCERLCPMSSISLALPVV